MRFAASFRRAAFGGLALLLATLAVGCGGGSDSSGTTETTLTVSGTITYTRIPLAKDANGRPTGLETDPAKFTSLPARNVMVRFYSSVEETRPDGTKTTVWKQAAGDAYTDTSGKYSAIVPKDTPVFVEVLSRTPTSIRLIAGAMNSSVNQADRPMYMLRKGLDGSSSDTNPVPGTKASANATVDFTVGVQDRWWLGVSTPTLLTSAVRETQGTGSRVLGILDSLYTFQATYGRVLPGNSGDTLDLHYLPGLAEPRGSYIEYDRTLFPQAYDPTTTSRHWFGSIKGGAADDDAWDEAVLWTLLGRNTQSYIWSNSLMPVGQNLTHLAPDLALAEGFALGMAANLLRSPFLADTAGAGATVLDIRDISSLTADQKGPYSGPAIAALSWEITLAANSIARPGTSATWANINTSAITRLFSSILPKDAADSTKVVDTFSIYGQVKRLQEAIATGEAVNLQAIFTDAVLTPMVAPFGLTWPRPTTGVHATYLSDWGTDPTTATTPLAAIQLSMAKAVQVRGVYPNASELEVAYTRFYMDKDVAYDFRIVTQPAVLPAGVTVEAFFPSVARTFSFSGGEAPVRLTLPGNATTPIFHVCRIRVVSPGQVAPDIQATVQLVPAS